MYTKLQVTTSYSILINLYIEENIVTLIGSDAKTKFDSVKL